MNALQPLATISSKLWLQAKITYWKLKFVAHDLINNS